MTIGIIAYVVNNSQGVHMKKTLVLGAILALTLPFTQAKAEALPEKYRIFGTNRYETSVRISHEGWDTSDVAIIATGTDFPDALSATPLAYKYDAPLLLVRDVLGSAERDLTRLGVKQVYIVGGKNAVGEIIEKQLNHLGIKFTRISGIDRYETSVKVADLVGNNGAATLASGQNFPDALSIAPIAAQLELPILLTKKDSVPATVQNYLENNDLAFNIVIGGNAVISESSVAKLNIHYDRIDGANRYETNSNVIAYFAEVLDFSTPFLATGTLFPDALSASSLAAAYNNPMVLVDPKKNRTTTKETIQQYKEFAEGYYVIGGPTALPDSAVDWLIK
jgi:cell wall-associated protease